jgi:hypothetical protein
MASSCRRASSAAEVARPAGKHEFGFRPAQPGLPSGRMHQPPVPPQRRRERQGVGEQRLLLTETQSSEFSAASIGPT